MASKPCKKANPFLFFRVLIVLFDWEEIFNEVRIVELNKGRVQQIRDNDIIVSSYVFVEFHGISLSGSPLDTIDKMMFDWIVRDLIDPVALVS